MKLLVIGTGYVGLVTGACFAEMGHHVTCLDIDEEKIDRLNRGEIPIYEPGLEEIVKRGLKARRLAFTTDYQKGVAENRILFLALPTPSLPNEECDLSYMQDALTRIALHMNDYRIIVNKSTVPIGTAHWAKRYLQELLQRHDKRIAFDIVSNPEFLKEGDAVKDCMRPDRIILGVEDPRIEAFMRELYGPFNLNHERILVMDPLSAEMCKYASNSMLATRISFMNELSGLCERLGADITKVRLGMGADERIGYHFLYAGAGYGGSCFPKDIRSLRSQARRLGYPMHLLDAVEKVNETQKRMLAAKIDAYYEGAVKGKTFGILGLSFKPGTDDMREASSLVLMEELLERGAHIRAFDPVAMPKARLLLDHPNIAWCDSEEETAEGAHALVLMTEWKQFRFLDCPQLLANMVGNAFFDGRNQYSRTEMARHGFDYLSVGRPAALTQASMLTEA